MRVASSEWRMASGRVGLIRLRLLARNSFAGGANRLKSTLSCETDLRRLELIRIREGGFRKPAANSIRPAQNLFAGTHHASRFTHYVSLLTHHSRYSKYDTTHSLPPLSQPGLATGLSHPNAASCPERE